MPHWLDTGNTAWQMTAATFVGLMSVPGLVVLYGGVMQKRWSINSMMLTFATFAVVIIVWVLWAIQDGLRESLVQLAAPTPPQVVSCTDSSARQGRS